jgi:hypothetical protein
VLPILARDAVVAGMAPRSILVAGAGAAVGILVGGGLIGALTLAVLAWVLATAIPVARRHLGDRPSRIDPFSLRDPWRSYVRAALQAQARFRHAVSGVAPGPLKDRLLTIGARLDQGVDEAGRVARRGQSLEDVRRQIDSTTAQNELAAIERTTGPEWGEGSSIQRTADALRSQLASAERLDKVLNDTYGRLQLLDARLDEAVARSLELSVSADSPEELGGVNTAVGEVLEEMEALRLALDEANASSGPPSGG